MSAAIFDINQLSENNVDIAVTADLADGVTISKLFVDREEIPKANASNWSVSGTVATIKKAYLATIEEGNNTFTIQFSDGSSAEFTISVVNTAE